MQSLVLFQEIQCREGSALLQQKGRPALICCSLALLSSKQHAGQPDSSLNISKTSQRQRDGFTGAGMGSPFHPHDGARSGWNVYQSMGGDEILAPAFNPLSCQQQQVPATESCNTGHNETIRNPQTHLIVAKVNT
ncbi:hypothetical protein DNTS_000285 [Danionella cerebrum]|uniref:Uncharacterized protein n=1 Tax=Danionella cerebrum TaxID=2873325 RepID=A0A553R700_9TELE|nr:hypothetical protein DNTS_000285 [Danionella translucida]